MKNKSFTLIELLVVIVIIGILASVIIISTSSSISKANFAKAKAFSANIKDAMMLDLVSEWTFDEPEDNGKTKDGWGVNHGTLHGAEQVDDCVFGKCYSFDGDGDYIDCGDNINLTNERGTISLWFLTHSLSYQKIFLFGKPTLYIETNGKLYINWQDSTGMSESAYTQGYQLTSGDLNTWKHVVFSYNSNGDYVLYLNSNLIDIQNSCSLSNINDVFKFSSSTLTFNGLIDDVRIYDTALSSSQIKQNYIAGLNSMLAKGVISQSEYNQKIVLLAEK